MEPPSRSFVANVFAQVEMYPSIRQNSHPNSMRQLQPGVHFHNTRLAWQALSSLHDAIGSGLPADLAWLTRLGLLHHLLLLCEDLLLSGCRRLAPVGR